MKDKLLSTVSIVQNPIHYNEWGVYGSLKVGDKLIFDNWLHAIEWLTFKTAKLPKVNWIDGTVNG